MSTVARRALSVFVVGCVIPVACDRTGVASRVPPAPPAASVDASVRSFCSSCHEFPSPEILPRGAWPKEVASMFEWAELIAHASVRDAIDPSVVTEWYTSRAPESLPMTGTTSGAGSGGLDMRPFPVRLPNSTGYPGVSDVQFVRLFTDEHLDLLICDMRSGQVFAMRPGAVGMARGVMVGSVPHPARAEVVDLDRDGRRDVLVANLGTVTPSDVTTGSVEWLRAIGEGRFERQTLLSEVGRVADVRAGDFDEDGDLDVLVGIFGWRRLGDVRLLVNVADAGEAPRFEAQPIDPRPGVIHLPVLDFDGDGHLDFVALFSQQFEAVELFLGDGRGGFRVESVFRAPHPNWGSSAIEVVDLDRDGDLDVLLTNGDSLDDLVIKPYHGVHWLENRGERPFTPRLVTNLYGAHCSKVADLDRDGDLDIVTSAFLPFVKPDTTNVEYVESLVWLRQTDGRFERFPLETRTPYHPRFDMGDVDGDGDEDLAVAEFTLGKVRGVPIDHVVDIWLQQAP